MIGLEKLEATSRFLWRIVSRIVDFFIPAKQKMVLD